MDYKIVIFIINLLPSAFSTTDPILTLPNGQILGREASTQQNTPYFAFEGIPYAAPPVEKLRFQPPQPVENWTNTLNATHSNVACYQMGSHLLNESENCLVLNVYTPNLVRESSADLLPVMVFLHGGGFVSGAGNLYQPDLFIDNAVVLVTLNYRLGIFGFISTEDKVIPGNNGLKDSLKAFEWVNANIHVFGGDHNRVTIFGQSAGSGACSLHLLNQKSLGLYQGVILQSGAFLTPVALQKNPRETAFGTAALLNSTFEISDDSEALLEFLQSVDVEELNAAAEQYNNAQSTWFSFLLANRVPWAPVIEVDNPDAVFTEKMYKLLKNGRIIAVPALMGVNSEESLAINVDPNATRNALEVIDKDLELLVPEDMIIPDPEARAKMGTSIRNVYTGGEPFADHVGDGVRYCSDNDVTRSSIKLAELYSKVADVYFYQFSYDGITGGSDVHYDGAENVGHGEELNYLFCSGVSCAYNLPKADLLTRQRLIKLWTDFAKFRNPTPDASELLQNITWPTVSSDDFFYLDINQDLEVRNHPKEETYKGWVTLYDSLDYDDFDTY